MKIDDSFDNKLNKVIEQLPDLEPANGAWAKIASQLDFEQKVDEGLVKLPEIELKQDAWENIANKLNHKTKTNAKARKLLVYSLSAAAMLALFLGIKFFFAVDFNAEITYSTEKVVEEEFMEELVVGQDPLEYLKKNCRTLPNVCKSEEFLEQKQTLEELNDESKNLTEAIESYGESPELIKSLIKVENLKSEVVKDLMKMMNS